MWGGAWGFVVGDVGGKQAGVGNKGLGKKKRMQKRNVAYFLSASQKVLVKDYDCILTVIIDVRIFASESVSSASFRGNSWSFVHSRSA